MKGGRRQGEGAPTAMGPPPLRSWGAEAPIRWRSPIDLSRWIAWSGGSPPLPAGESPRPLPPMVTLGWRGGRGAGGPFPRT